MTRDLHFACHPEERSDEGPALGFFFSGAANHIAAKSCHAGFMLSIRAIFFALRHPLISFSREIALRTLSCRSK